MHKTIASAALALLLSALILACSGSENGGGVAEGRFETPDAAARALLDALVKRDQQAFLRAVDPDYRARPAELSVLVGLALPQLTGREEGAISFSNLELYSRLEEDGNHASVLISGQVEIGGRRVFVTDEPLFTVKRGGSWYVTSPSSPYWSARLRSSPTDAHAAQLDASPLLPGVYVPPYAGEDGQLGTTDDRAHVANGVSVPFCDAPGAGVICYNSNPPTSGVHAVSPVPFGVLTSPAPKESLVHNMEHGGVIVWYNTRDAEAVRLLTTVVTDATRRGDLVVLSAYAEMEPETVALTAWTRLDKFPVAQLTRQRVDEFIRVHSRRFNPEGF